jgi:hypothetical protein
MFQLLFCVIRVRGIINMKSGLFVYISRLIAFTFVSLSLAACTPLVWMKPGATTSDFNTDKYTCEQNSMKATPNTPILTNCNLMGTCTVQDFNQGNRNQLFNDCMVSKGWSLQKQDQSSTQQPENTQTEKPPNMQAERAKQRIEENKACTQKHEDGTFKTWKEVADCKNRNWASWVRDSHYRWPDLITSLSTTRSQLAAKLDAGKITEEDMNAKIADKLTTIKTEELKRKAIISGSATQKPSVGNTP